MKQSGKEAIEDISPQMLVKHWENMNSRINHVVSVNGEHVEQDCIWLNSLQNFYCSAY